MHNLHIEDIAPPYWRLAACQGSRTHQLFTYIYRKNIKESQKERQNVVFTEGFSKYCKIARAGLARPFGTMQKVRQDLNLMMMI
jgi:hypothetical protein